MALFQRVHARALVDAYHMLRDHSESRMYVQMALQERVLFKPPTDILGECSFRVVTLMLDRSGRRLEVVDKASQQAIDDWEERNADAAPELFEVPLSLLRDDRCHR